MLEKGIALQKKDRAAFIMNRLNDIYPDTPIPLKHSSDFELLIAVLLSAQCTDERVNKITPDLFKIANNPVKMTEISVDDIYSIIRPCGLAPRKSKAIWELSHILVQQHNGQVPKTLDALEALPGIGHKSAQVVIGQNFGIPAFAVDTHIHRLSYRWVLSTGKNVERTEKDLKRLFPKNHWNKLHNQMIYFGREHCPARGHQPIACPICKHVGRKSL